METNSNLSTNLKVLKGLSDLLGKQEKAFNKGMNELLAEYDKSVTDQEATDQETACDKAEDFARRCKSQEVFSKVKVIDVLNFVRKKTADHDEFKFYLEITDNVYFGKNNEGEHVSQDNKVIFHDVDLDKFEFYVPDAFMLREVQDFTIGLDEKSIIMSLAD